jgi:hypothetical protein
VSQDLAPVRHAPTGRQVVVAAALIGGTWAFGATLPLGSDLSYPPAVLDLAYYVRVVTGSSLFATLAVVAWLIVRLAPARKSIRTTAGLVATCGVTAAIGNLLEDGLGIANAGILYGLGVFGMLFSLIGLGVALAVGRQALLAGLEVLTLAGLVSAFGHGPPLMPLVWFGVAAWVAIRGVPRSLVRSGSAGLQLPDAPVP